MVVDKDEYISFVDFKYKDIYTLIKCTYMSTNPIFLTTPKVKKLI
jgi:hypothetical protein